jgi:hypothetical protein
MRYKQYVTIIAQNSIAQGSQLAARSTLRNYRRAILQELRSGDDHLVPRFNSILHFQIVADRLSDLLRRLPRHKRSAIPRFRDKCEILSGQPRHGQDRHFRILVRTKDHPRPHKFQLPQRVIAVGDARFH